MTNIWLTIKLVACELTSGEEAVAKKRIKVTKTALAANGIMYIPEQIPAMRNDIDWAARVNCCLSPWITEISLEFRTSCESHDQQSQLEGMQLKAISYIGVAGGCNNMRQDHFQRLNRW